MYHYAKDYRSDEMKKSIFILFFWGGQLIAQNHGPVFFDRFTQSPEIEWAGWRTDTFHFTSINLSEILRKKYNQGTIKVCMPDAMVNFDPCCIHYASTCEIKWGSQCNADIPIFDDSGNVVKKPTEEQKRDNELIPENELNDSSVFNVLEIPQLLYFENNRLKVFIPFVYTKRSIITSGQINLGPALLFATCFNFKRKQTAGKRDKIIPLQQTTKRINIDSIFIGYEHYQVKEMYEKNIAKMLWPLISNESPNVYSAVNGSKLSMNDLNNLLNQGEKIVVPVYDSTGNITASEYFFKSTLSPAVFKEIEITQQWYYNETKNIVYCFIPQIILYAPLFKNGTYEAAPSPVVTILFKNQ